MASESATDLVGFGRNDSQLFSFLFRVCIILSNLKIDCYTTYWFLIETNIYSSLLIEE